MLNEAPFLIFGSPSSKDYDVMIILPELHVSLEMRKRIAHQYNQTLSSILSDKPLNCNLGVISDGVISSVFKGTVDEVNNSIFTTYEFHKQFYPQLILRKLSRDVDLKILRTARVLLSFYSRTEFRDIVKPALRSNLLVKLDTLNKIPFNQTCDFGKNQSPLDVIKTLAFQLGQTLGLMNDLEFYSKESISEHYPNLAPLLQRQVGVSFDALEDYKKLFIEQVSLRIPHMKSLTE